MRDLFAILAAMAMPSAYAEKWTDYSMMLSDFAGKTIEGGMWGWERISGQPANVRGLRFGLIHTWPQPQSIEIFELQKTPTNGWCDERWIRLRGDYSNWINAGLVMAEYRMKKEIFYNSDNNKGIDITYECGSGGEHYALQTISDKPYWIHAWGEVYVNGIKQHDFFHYHKWSLPRSITNSSWQGGGSKTRPAIMEEESWWDSIHGWHLNGRPMPEGSVGMDGTPDGVIIPIARREYIAKQAGRQWYVETPSILWSTWLYSSWPY